MGKSWHGWYSCIAWDTRPLLELLLLLPLLGNQRRTAVVVGGEIMGGFHLAQSASASR